MAESAENILCKEDVHSKSKKCQSATEISECLKSCVKYILNQVTDDQFLSLYKACYKEFEMRDEVARPALSGSSTEGKKYHIQFNDMIMRSTCKVIEETVLNMDNKLKELEELKLSQSGSTIYWRPPGNASLHMMPFEFISELEKKKDLESKIEKEQEVLNILKTRLNQKRNKANKLNEILLSLMEEIKKIVTSEVNDKQLKELLN